MGMYTELIFEAKLSGDTPKDVIDAISLVCKDCANIKTTSSAFAIDNIIEHFDLWYLLTSNSAYFPAQYSYSRIYYNELEDTYSLFIRSDLKNYEKQIDKFLEYIKPYIVKGMGSKDIYAYVLYETGSEPTIYSLK